VNLGDGYCRALVLILVAGTSLQSDDGSIRKRHDSCVVCPAVQAEVEALKLSNGKDICLSIKGKDPSHGVIRQLQESSVRIKGGSECTRRPHGILVAVEKIDRARLSADVLVESMNMDLDGSHLATLLRIGVYRLRLVDGSWTVETYTPNTETKASPR